MCKICMITKQHCPLTFILISVSVYHLHDMSNVTPFLGNDDAKSFLEIVQFRVCNDFFTLCSCQIKLMLMLMFGVFTLSFKLS